MYVHSVKLVNFKSFGAYPENEVILEPRVTAVIGKNESGKSNVLDGLSHIEFLSKKSSAFNTSDVNRNSPTGTEISYSLVLKPSSDDLASGIIEDTKVELTRTSAKVTGGFFLYYLQTLHDEFVKFVAFLDEESQNPFQVKDQELATYRACKAEMQDGTSLDLYGRMSTLNFLHAKAGSFPSTKRQDYRDRLGLLRDKWFMLQSLLPTFFYRRSDKHLNAIYKLEDVDKELKSATANPASLLYSFVELIEVPVDDFLTAVKSSTESRAETLRMRIQRKVEEKINQPFHDFYQTETISLHVRFNSNAVSFVVQSDDGEALMLSERSNGLRWYLETFIDARANNISGRNVVYLLDEPGTSLHVNAQRELLRLFRHLTNQGNQIVYTTHSPYMLDFAEEGVHRIRAVVKDSTGFSRIYKNAYDAKIAPESQQDTLAPIINALGMNLHDTFGPAKDKINIVTEGMSDYIYLSTMSKVLDVDSEKYAIIPSVGASNCVHICQILHGWGCKYIALFDYDKAGVESGGEYMRKEMLFECGKQYCYVREISPEEIEAKTYKTQRYMIEDVMLQSEIDRFCDETGTSKDLGKPLTAKLMCTAIEKSTFEIAQQSRDNFQLLFERIFSAFN